MKQHLNTAAGKKKLTLEEKQRLRQIEKSNQMITLPEAEMDLYARLILPSLDKGIYGWKSLFCGSASLLSLAVPPGTPRSKALHIRKTAGFQLDDFFSA